MERYKGRLLNLDRNAKTVKGQKRGYKTAILYLAPANLSGFNVCPMATRGCTAACLNTAGQSIFASVQKARIAKTRFFFEHREAFLAQLVEELVRFVDKSLEQGFEPVVRLNGTSDILWERVPIELYPIEHHFHNDALIQELHDKHGYVAPNIMTLFPDVQFYDYTKHIPSKRSFDLPENYRLVFSWSDHPTASVMPLRALQALRQGWNVAVVFRKVLPETFLNKPVINGDADDLRFLDPPGVIVGLKAKGRAKHDTSGFVQE